MLRAELVTNGKARVPGVEIDGAPLEVTNEEVEVQVIAPNAVLMAVAQSRPRDLDELARIAGMDEFRVRQYGAEMLAAMDAAS